MELALDLEDDLFFADLSKQISLLIMEEDDGISLGLNGVEEAELPIPPYCQYSSTLRGFPRAISNDVPLMASCHVPAYEPMDCSRRENITSKGTGVFIPKCAQPRRKTRQGRFNSRWQSHGQRQINGTDDRHHYNGITRSQTPQHSHHNSFHPNK